MPSESYEIVQEVLSMDGSRCSAHFRRKANLGCYRLKEILCPTKVNNGYRLHQTNNWPTLCRAHLDPHRQQGKIPNVEVSRLVPTDLRIYNDLLEGVQYLAAFAIRCKKFACKSAIVILAKLVGFRLFLGRCFHMLSQAISPAAMHDSSERYPPPRCRNGTRAEITAQDIVIWARKPEPSTTKVVWLQGPPNTAKTAIAQTVSEVCHAEGRLAGSFFFDQHRCGGDDGHYLFLTIAYQMAMNVPGMREHINLAMAHDPTLPTKSIAVQMQSLIIRPFQQLPSTSTTSSKMPMVVVIDGLDQCWGQETR
ncbi:hypothetical protein BDZ97DRAFT_2064734 [Flammula alnicola]|nr:hypothetical protein BDZ97DRAFT_2064734 [Flammula alnicola]